MIGYQVTEQEKRFLDYVKVFRGIGYGRMMQIISYEWYTQEERENPDLPVMKESALVSGGCFAFLSEKQKKEYLAILEQDKKLGMNY